MNTNEPHIGHNPVDKLIPKKMLIECDLLNVAALIRREAQQLPATKDGRKARRELGSLADQVLAITKRISTDLRSR